MFEKLMTGANERNQESEAERALRLVDRLKQDYCAVKSAYDALLEKNKELTKENQTLRGERKVALDILSRLKSRISALQASVDNLRRESEKLRANLISDIKTADNAGTVHAEPSNRATYPDAAGRHSAAGRNSAFSRNTKRPPCRLSVIRTPKWANYDDDEGGGEHLGACEIERGGEYRDLRDSEGGAEKHGEERAEQRGGRESEAGKNSPETEAF